MEDDADVHGSGGGDAGRTSRLVRMTETRQASGPQTGVTAYRWAPLTDHDVPAWADLVNHLAVVDGTEEFYHPEDLAEELTSHGVDAARDTWAVWAGEDMVAWTAVGCPSTPDHEGHGRAHLGCRRGHRARGRALGCGPDRWARWLDSRQHLGAGRAGCRTDVRGAAPAGLRRRRRGRRNRPGA